MSNTMTPYAASKMVNAQLKELGIDKELPPQMFYTYTRKNYIKSITVNNKIRITQDDLTTWFVGYVNKLQGKVTVSDESNIDENQLALDI